jgi:hypothetical protein
MPPSANPSTISSYLLNFKFGFIAISPNNKMQHFSLALFIFLTLIFITFEQEFANARCNRDVPNYFPDSFSTGKSKQVRQERVCLTAFFENGKG